MMETSNEMQKPKANIDPIFTALQTHLDHDDRNAVFFWLVSKILELQNEMKGLRRSMRILFDDRI